jgi:probable DNA metabolism protein
MHSVTLRTPNDFATWRSSARTLLANDVPPEDIAWSVESEGGQLFDNTPATPLDEHATVRVPRAFLGLASEVVMHRDPHRFALLYRLLWRLRGEPRLLEVAVDADVSAARAMAKAIHRDIHKLHAFVRFREVTDDGDRGYLAWFEPTHHIVEAATPFFVRRFPNTCWAILTPEVCAYWDRQTLTFGPGAQRSDVPREDATETLWLSYYSSIFNPARLKVAAMRGHMPQRYWKNLPESALIPGLIDGAHERAAAMLDAAPTTPARTIRKRAATRAPSIDVDAHDLNALSDAASHCRNCPLWKDATQTVFGEGTDDARVMLVGEQPGDQEDLAGKPFVGPAGRLLDRALAEVGLDRKQLYVTNAVKHFKFGLRGKRRIHKTPAQQEVLACHPWLEREIAVVEPKLIVALGGTAARAVFGRVTPIEKNRGRIIEGENGAPDVLVTVHPSYLLRVPDEDKDAAYERFVQDLRLARHLVIPE